MTCCDCSTYTEPSRLMKGLEVRPGERYGETGLTYSVAVTSLGSTRKTELILVYIEE